jgi:sulfite exporter TauE/SafE
MKIFQARKQSSDSRRGGAMVMAAFAISTMSVLAMSMVTIQVSSTVEQNRAAAADGR